jgi:hypothetical protein
MHIDTAREAKANVWRWVCDEVSIQSEHPGVRGFLGLSVKGPGRFGLAVRYRDGAGPALARRAVELAGDEVDIREIGAVRHLAAVPGLEAGDLGEWRPEQLQRRVRPLHPGLSLGQRNVSAGTLGAFVSIADRAGVFVLSNNHVLADSDRARVGDPVLQPAPGDKGTATDRVGHLARFVHLSTAGEHTVDAAVAQLDPGDTGEPDPTAVDTRYPSGHLTGVAELTDEGWPADDVLVEKVGRTTGVTRGFVTAIELDAVTVEYPVGPVTFDNQIEVTGLEGAFSAGGDSGALVYRPDTLQAVGLLFAGSERGGVDGAPLTYCNPMGLVLEALGATLVR